MDENLNDNSQGYNNYSAPGADRLQITTSLFKKPLDNFDDDNFIELATIDEGVLKAVGKTGTLSGSWFHKDWSEILARRTYAAVSYTHLTLPTTPYV